MLDEMEDIILGGGAISRDDARRLAFLPAGEMLALLASANRLRERFRKNAVDLCAIVNAKSGACSEDCSYCAQSCRSTAEIAAYPLLSADAVIEKAGQARDGGARRFCIVTSGRKPSGRELDLIAAMVSSVRGLGLLPCATLGLLAGEELRLLKDAGLERFHNNLETSERFFPSVCSTHSYEDKLRTIRSVKEIGLSLCSGGLFGMGETWDDRIDMAYALRDLEADSVPINFLAPITGTAMAGRPLLDPAEALKIVSLFRFLLPDRQIRVCGGRLQTLGELHPLIFQAGADGLLIGNYLTTLGRGFGDDLSMITGLGLEPVPPAPDGIGLITSSAQPPANVV